MERCFRSSGAVHDARRMTNAEKDVDGDSAQQELAETADGWRSGARGSEAEESADEVAHGADRAAEQPDYGREGS